MEKLIQDIVVGAFLVGNLLGVSQCAKAQPADAVAYVALTLCVSPYVHWRDDSTFRHAAWARGYYVRTGTGPDCAATLFASDSDWAEGQYMGFDDGTLDGGRPARLTLARAEDILTAWEARLR